MSCRARLGQELDARASDPWVSVRAVGAAECRTRARIGRGHDFTSGVLCEGCAEVSSPRCPLPPLSECRWESPTWPNDFSWGRTVELKNTRKQKRERARARLGQGKWRLAKARKAAQRRNPLWPDDIAHTLAHTCGRRRGRRGARRLTAATCCMTQCDVHDGRAAHTSPQPPQHMSGGTGVRVRRVRVGVPGAHNRAGRSRACYGLFHACLSHVCWRVIIAIVAFPRAQRRRAHRSQKKAATREECIAHRWSWIVQHECG